MGFDDVHSRLAYREIHGDEKAATCADFLRWAAVFFAAASIDRIEQVLTDNAYPYRKSFAWRQALADLGASRKLTRGYRPQTNGTVERFNAPCSTNGPTCGPRPATPNARPPWMTSSTATTTIAAAPHSEASHPSAV